VENNKQFRVKQLYKKYNLASTLNLIPGWRTKRKIVVFESDDWGSLRLPSSEVWRVLTGKGFGVENYYNRLDGLETEEDLNVLFDILLSFRDSYNNHPVFTANCLMANPDFKRISKENFHNYYFQLVTDTFAEHKGCEKSFHLWRKGLEAGVFYPQFHGREHLNVELWMNALRNGDAEARLCFDFSFWAHKTKFISAKRKHFLAAFDYDRISEVKAILEIVKDGLSIFEKLLGYNSRSFVAPNYIWSDELESTLVDCGVFYIQGQRKQLIPDPDHNGYYKKPHFTGQNNSLGQTYLVRNAYFEPASDPDLDWVNLCLRDISRAFYWQKPAVISSHRVNYISRINPLNQKRNVLLLKKLISEIIRKWPDTEFLTSVQLGDIINLESRNFIKLRR